MSTPIQHSYAAVVIHPHQNRALLLPDAAGWGLPGFSDHERRVWQDVAHVNRGVGAILGAPVHTLRCLTIDYQQQDAAERLVKIYAVQVIAEAWSPPAGAIWADADDLARLDLAVPDQRPVIAGWLAWRTAAPAPLRAPWYRPGWADSALAWAAAQLERLGAPAAGPAEQVRSWQRSAIWRLPTADGAAYLKAVPPMFGHEPALTAALAQADPRRFVTVLAADPARGLLLMRDYGGTPLDQLREVERWEQALHSFAEIQIATARRAEGLRALGVPVRPLAELADRAAPLLADHAAMLPDNPAGLSDGDRAALSALAPRLARLCADLARHRLPPTIEHGDFWAGQIIAVDGGYRFTDWSDSSIAHPFFSLLLFLVEIEDFFPKVPDVRERLRDAYLRPWSRGGRRSALVRAFELAQPLAALHHALTYHELILPNMEVRWEMELMVPFYLKMLLRLARQQQLIEV